MMTEVSNAVIPLMTSNIFKRIIRLVGRSSGWRSAAASPPDERMPSDVPEGLKFLKEHELGEDDLLSRDIESYRCEGSGEKLTYDTQPVVFHMDQSDQYRHINTVKYMDRVLDLLSLQYHKIGGDVGRLRFHEIVIYFRKPFVPGQVADAELDFVHHKDGFHGAVRFYHCNGDGTRSERISMAMKRAGLWRMTCEVSGEVCKGGNIVRDMKVGSPPGIELKVMDGGCVARETGVVLVLGV